MHITLGHSTLLFLASAVAAAAIAYWMYRGTVPRLSTTRRWFLGSLRFLSLTVILFLLARPILSRLIDSRVEPVLAILLDSSESVGVGGATNDSTAAVDVRRIAKAALEQDVPGEIHLYSFDGAVRAIQRGSLDSIEFRGQRTDVAGALESVFETYVDGNLGGVLVVSDGRFNSGQNPIHLADRSPVPIYTVTVGDSTERRDVRIAALNTNELTYSGVEVPVQVRLDARGYEGRRVSVSLLVDGETVDNTSVVLPADRVEETVDLQFVPPRPGLIRVAARVSPLEGEVTLRNNATSTVVRVLDSRRSVLLIGSAPDPDVSALLNTISAGDETEVTRIVQRDGPSFYGEDFPSDLSSFDLIVLVGYPGAGANVQHIARLAERVEQGTPLLFTLTRTTDLRLFREHIAPLLGLTARSVRRGFFDAAIVLTPEGKRHPVFKELDGDDVFGRLPPLSMNESSWGATADAAVLATLRVRGIDIADPSIVTRRTGVYRTAAILGAGHWRLTNLPEDLSAYDDLWRSVVGNLVQWLSATRDDRPVRVRATRNQYAGDEQIELLGQVYDESLQPIDDATVQIRVTSPDGNEFRHTMKPIGSGRYSLELRPPGEGSYGFSARALRDDVELGSDSGNFAVGNLTLEFRDTSSDPVIMRQISHRSGGVALDAVSLLDLRRILTEDSTFVVRSTTARNETELWRQFPFAIAVIVLLTIEWITRKRSGLS